MVLKAKDYDPALRAGAQIEGDNIEDGTITSAEIATGAVDTDEIAADAVENAEIADNAVSLEQLDSGITPSHVVKFAGEFTTAGGDTDETISVSGVVATDLVTVTLHTAGASPVTIIDASAGTDQIDVDMSADPSTDHVLTYTVYRAAA